MKWILLSMFIPVGVMLIQMKQRQKAPVAGWPWWVVLCWLWLPILAVVGFGLAMLVFAGFMYWLNGPMLL